VVHNDRGGYFVHFGAGCLTVYLKRFLMTGLWVIGIAAAAVLLFLAGDHDEEDRNSGPAPSSSHSGRNARACCGSYARVQLFESRRYQAYEVRLQ
jgi:hypothetical protein